MNEFTAEISEPRKVWCYLCDKTRRGVQIQTTMSDINGHCDAIQICATCLRKALKLIEEESDDS